MPYSWVVAIVLTVYGIETNFTKWNEPIIFLVAIVLTVYGIETCALQQTVLSLHLGCNSTYRLRY